MTIAGAVLCSNVYWRWTPNGYLASIIAIVVAYLATVVLTALIERWTAARAVVVRRR